MDFTQLRHCAPQITRLAKKHGISRIFVFGSVARRESTNKSDADLLVELQEGTSLFQMAGFNYEAEQLLHISVDIIPTSLLPTIKDRWCNILSVKC